MQIKQSEHVFIAGMTGSGKTYLAETYLASYPNVIALDTKGFIDWSIAGYVPVYERLVDLQNFGEGKAIYRPAPEEMNEDFYNLFFKWVYERQNTICYIDELMSVATASTVPFYLKAILTRGRQRNTSCWALTQRPSGIPLITMSEATHYFIFDLKLEEDRERIRRITGSDLFEYKPSEYGKLKGIKKDYLFFYYNAKMDDPTLNIIVQKSNNELGVKSW